LQAAPDGGRFSVSRVVGMKIVLATEVVKPEVFGRQLLIYQLKILTVPTDHPILR
jgi:hypothetical protein